MLEYMDNKLRIYAALDGIQVDHQATMVEIEGKVSNTSISILIDLVLSEAMYHPRLLKHVN